MKKNTYAPLTLTVPNEMWYLPVVLQTIQGLCNRHGFDHSTSTQVVIACEEAIANVIKHAYLPNEAADFTVVIEPFSTGITCRIRDKGMPYNPDDEQFDADTLKGLGTFMIGKMMDQVQFHNLGNRGKELLMRKFFPPDVTEQEKLQVVSPTVQTPVAPRPEQVTFRLFQPQDALEIARCAYESYGYTYVYEHIYFPERIRELNASGDLISLVASFGNEILGHIGLVKFDGASGLYEFGLAMTKQGYRGLQIFSKLMELAVSEAKKRGVTALFGQCVTTHIFSQKAPSKIGMCPTALLCAYVPSEIDFRQIKKADNHRSAVLVFTQIYQTRDMIHVFAPSHLRPLLQRIYDGLEQTVTFRIAQPPTSQLAETSLSINANLRMGKLFLQRYGDDIDQHLRLHIRQVQQDGVQMIEAFVNLFLPGAATLIEAAERQGFVVVGLMPGAVEGDFLVLQYFNGIHVQLADIELLPEGTFLLQHIHETINP